MFQDDRAPCTEEYNTERQSVFRDQYVAQYNWGTGCSDSRGRGEAGGVQGGPRIPHLSFKDFSEALEQRPNSNWPKQKKGNLLFHKAERSGHRLQAQPDLGFK